ncbi:MAG: hypothetical protein ACE5JP_15900, partial [Candidatus Bipolaricaulia bacterium]
MRKAFMMMVVVLVVTLCGQVFSSYAVSGNQVILATTEDGRKVELMPDGTWRYLPRPEEQDWSKIVELKSFKATYLGRNFFRGEGPQLAHVRLYLQFKNISDKTITGLAYEMRFRDAFGDIVYSDSVKDNIVIQPGRANPMSEEYWYYDEEEIGYDKLRDSVQAGTVKVSVNITKIAFADGIVL